LILLSYGRRIRLCGPNVPVGIPFVAGPALTLTLTLTLTCARA